MHFYLIKIELDPSVEKIRPLIKKLDPSLKYMPFLFSITLSLETMSIIQ